MEDIEEKKYTSLIICQSYPLAIGYTSKNPALSTTHTEHIISPTEKDHY